LRVDRELADTIARAALAEPYRQVDVLTTEEMARRLND